jgi:ketosteroid isomerase-like protein
MNALVPTAIRRALALASALVLALNLIPASRAAQSEEQLHEELRQLKTVYEKAISSGDLAPLESLFTPESSGVVVDNQPFRNFAELKDIYDRFRAQFPGVVYRITLDPEKSRIFGDLAVAYGTASEDVTTDAGNFKYQSSFTVILRRTPAGWKLVRSQVTMDPFGNSVVAHFLSRTKLYYGLGALLVGALVGFAAGRASGRRASTLA